MSASQIRGGGKCSAILSFQKLKMKWKRPGLGQSFTLLGLCKILGFNLTPSGLRILASGWNHSFNQVSSLFFNRTCWLWSENHTYICIHDLWPLRRQKARSSFTTNSWPTVTPSLWWDSNRHLFKNISSWWNVCLPRQNRFRDYTKHIACYLLM